LWCQGFFQDVFRLKQGYPAEHTTTHYPKGVV